MLSRWDITSTLSTIKDKERSFLKSTAQKEVVHRSTAVLSTRGQTVEINFRFVGKTCTYRYLLVACGCGLLVGCRATCADDFAATARRSICEAITHP
jgi:hypothetical protein